MQTTLLLSVSYEPMQVISWREAIKLYFLEKVEVLESYDENLRAVSLTMKVPAVIRLVRSFKRKKKTETVKFSRLKVFTRDRFTCQYCRTPGEFKELTFDHVLPRSRGGLTNWENIVTACKSCNTKKRDRTPEEANMSLAKLPVRPKWLPAVSITITHQRSHSAWKEYLWS
jgi:5-methylcytosine-specific restriction endonuclease McrA